MHNLVYSEGPTFSAIPLGRVGEALTTPLNSADLACKGGIALIREIK